MRNSKTRCLAADVNPQCRLSCAGDPLAFAAAYSVISATTNLFGLICRHLIGQFGALIRAGVGLPTISAIGGSQLIELPLSHPDGIGMGPLFV